MELSVVSNVLEQLNKEIKSFLIDFVETVKSSYEIFFERFRIFMVMEGRITS